MSWSKERRGNGLHAAPTAAISRQGCGQCDVQGGPQSSRDAVSELTDCAASRSRAGAIRQTHLEASGLLNEAVTWKAPMAISLAPASESPDPPSSLRTPSYRKVALWATACPQSRGLSADEAQDSSRGCGQTFQTAGDGRRCRLSRPGADTFICVRPFTGLRPAGCDGAGTPLAPGAGTALEDPVCRAQGHCGDWPTGPEGAGRGMPSSLWDCSNLRLAIEPLAEYRS